MNGPEEQGAIPAAGNRGCQLTDDVRMVRRLSISGGGLGNGAKAVQKILGWWRQGELRPAA